MSVFLLSMEQGCASGAASEIGTAGFIGPAKLDFCASELDFCASELDFCASELDFCPSRFFGDFVVGDVGFLLPLGIFGGVYVRERFIQIYSEVRRGEGKTYLEQISEADMINFCVTVR